MIRPLLTFFVLISIGITSLRGQDREVTGKVISQGDSLGLPGVNVVVKGTMIGTATDYNGYYSLFVPDEDTLILAYTYIGYRTQEVVIRNRSSINITLLPDYTELETVVVTGYKSEVKGDIIGSISSVTAKDFEDMPVIGMDQA
ncbi:MAG: carboxypeptidase-like regulatory domain-containing protein, partial [Cyclobacteriaceae bacterium]|nr:carboxypeptidase-like regulatory domain-containing protein [Cyclobacteriaceae bacterium]